MIFKSLFIFLMFVVAAHGVCELPKAVGPCRAKIPRWYSDSNGACKLFFYSGCKGNANNFESEQSCVQACVNVCELPQSEGSCRGSFERWFYSDSDGACEPFNYTGCGGNDNNFETKESCEETCYKTVVDETIVGIEQVL